ncbi:hypothetical protein [Synechococcus phage S-N03]|uniref:Uncharacterized protein n=1 Tax=Synechococcus phage S-N03 TaxID=2718943 RepID=A0A6G8R5M8_9CAUD|nr:hypothetical protein PQC09_gp070 [Synechococcus phage S-N03]QIN96705.1 hypothetical protein [Synechococcus phage S-N03]
MTAEKGYTSKHRRAHHVDEGPDRVLIFWKNNEKARKAIVGAAYNFVSRVAAGVAAGYIMVQLNPGVPPQQQVTPQQGAAAVGAVIN